MKNYFGLMLLVGSCLLTGCHKTGVFFTEVKPSPTAAISNGVAIIHVESERLDRGVWLEMKSHIDGQTLCVSGYRSSSEPELEHELVVKLPSSTPSTAVVWLNPDGSRVPIPFAP